jgi:hypothetical protein
VFERMGAKLWPGFAGVIIVEARKELMGAIPKAAPAKGKRRPVPAAQGVLKRHPETARCKASRAVRLDEAGNRIEGFALDP